jgi:hypothetical protein
MSANITRTRRTACIPLTTIRVLRLCSLLIVTLQTIIGAFAVGDDLLYFRIREFNILDTVEKE